MSTLFLKDSIFFSLIVSWLKTELREKLLTEVTDVAGGWADIKLYLIYFLFMMNNIAKALREVTQICVAYESISEWFIFN